MSESKAYSMKKLLEKVKDQLKDQGEEAAEMLYDSFMDWLVESAQESTTPLDDIVIVAKPHIDKIVKEQIDKIDGEVG